MSVAAVATAPIAGIAQPVAYGSGSRKRKIRPLSTTGSVEDACDGGKQIGLFALKAGRVRSRVGSLRCDDCEKWVGRMVAQMRDERMDHTWWNACSIQLNGWLHSVRGQRSSHWVRDIVGRWVRPFFIFFYYGDPLMYHYCSGRAVDLSLVFLPDADRS
jgi:hypothetical protein